MLLPLITIFVCLFPVHLCTCDNVSLSDNIELDACDLAKKGAKNYTISQELSHNGVEEVNKIFRFIFEFDDLHKHNSLAEVGLMGLNTLLASSEYSYLYMHRYENYNELKQGSSQSVDQELCLKQLTDLNERTRKLKTDKYSTNDINLYQYLDTFGRVPSGLLVGNLFWDGMYNECLRLKLITSEGKLPARYCVATFKHKDWPKGEEHDIYSLSSGICLPKTCDSLNHKNKYKLIKELIEFNARDFDKDQLYISNVYCLPEENSPLRSLWYSPKNAITAMVVVLWISVLIYATIKDNLLNNSSYEMDKRALSLTGGLDVESKEDSDVVNIKNSLRIYRTLSITNNLKRLFDTSKESLLLKLAEEKSGAKKESQVNNNGFIIDLRGIEAIKVFSMCYVIIGHVLMCSTVAVIDGRELINSHIFSLANLVPAFAVNSFFSITGILTCYLMMKSQKLDLILKPSRWFGFIAYRYLRIIPLYLLVVLYCKNLAKYANHGPFWDYGTSSLSHRRRCEQESWLWPLTLTANFKPPLEHCIPSAWYLANDFHFFIVTPLFLALLHKNPVIGKRLIITCILTGYLAGFYSIFASDVKDYRPIALFLPNGFKTYITHLSFNYTRPMYRIPAYLCGLYIGYALYEFEQKKLEYNSADKEARKQMVEPDWSEKFKKYCAPFCAFLLTLCLVTPYIAAWIPFNLLWARIMVAFITPLYHIIFALAVGLYILIMTTGYGNTVINNIMTSPIWKPFARLSLCVVLTNVEVVTYIIQSRKATENLSHQYLLSLNLLSIVACYFVAIIVCVLFEAPIREALNYLLSFILKKIMPTNEKKDK